MPSGLNYSKWDNLELSDDSDIEVHPNVDKKSFIRWKQRDIHEKRDIRKSENQQLQAESSNNKNLATMIKRILSSTKAEGSSFYSKEVSRLTAGRADRGNKDGPEGPTADDMILSLLLQINEEPSVKGKTSTELDQALVTKLEEHDQKLAERQLEVEKEIQKRQEEDKKKITSEGIREGWSSGHISKAEAAQPAPQPKKKPASKTQQIETLNSGASSSSPSSKPSLSPDSDAEDDNDEEVPTLTDAMRQFANLPSAIPSFVPTSASIKALPSTFNPSKHMDPSPFEVAYKFLAAHKELTLESSGTPDALLVEAFQASMRGEAALARKCTEKALMVQYCQKLGKDGLSLFFKRMTGTDGRAAVVYFNDVLATYSRISTRASEMAAESKASGQSSGAAGTEQIQLVAEDPSVTISFNVPDGPAPEHIELEGEGSENMDINLVREFLDRRWKIFNDFSKEMQDALKTQKLDEVNKVLGEMAVEPAEKIVELLDQAGILNFGQKPEEGAEKAPASEVD